MGATIVLSVKYLAGETTKVDAAIDVCEGLGEAIKELAPKWWVQVGTLVTGALMFHSNRRLKQLSKSQVSRIAELTKNMEVALDPKRSSSGLGHDGETHEKDKL
ncbi:hypothetical protein XAP3CFBP6996_005520 [Xanthomonas citri pv. fuscans CFBP 6996]|nr:hypothetical protein XAP3CFBP6996_005520 [Xanthomonas citri pv. fuscans CFBP 6996]QWN15384.1 hypothetical protein DGN02_05535 [Xanthomonas citri]